jgi:hypothetical protein
VRCSFLLRPTEYLTDLIEETKVHIGFTTPASCVWLRQKFKYNFDHMVRSAVHRESHRTHSVACAHHALPCTQTRTHARVHGQACRAGPANSPRGRVSGLAIRRAAALPAVLRPLQRHVAVRRLDGTRPRRRPCQGDMCSNSPLRWNGPQVKDAFIRMKGVAGRSVTELGMSRTSLLRKLVIEHVHQ